MIRRIFRRASNLIRWRSKRSTTFASFAEPLKQVCLLMSPEMVLEFGPGYSTDIFLKHSNAKIISVETDIGWYEKYKNQFDPTRVEVIYKQLGWDLGEIRDHGKNFSLVFVDGWDRVAALEQALHLIDDNGAVFLHDAHREDYEQGIRLYPFIYFVERHSCLLFKSKVMYNRAKASVPADYSCSCRYCSPDARRAYFAQFIGS